MTTLYLTSRGTRAQVRNGMFVVENTESKTAWSISEVTEIVCSKSIALTSDVIFTAAKHGIEILFVEGEGIPVARIWNNRFGSISTIRKHQILWLKMEDCRKYVVGLIERKVENQIQLLHLLSVRSQIALPPSAINQMNALLISVREVKSTAGNVQEHAARLRGLEGKCGALYFSAISTLLPENYRFHQRSQHPARDQFNAFLNYAYGMLYGKVETCLIRAGLDPALGMMHRDEYNKPVLTYDLIEPFRVWAEMVVTNLFLQQAIYADFTDLRADGGIWLNQYGKRILVSAMLDYLAEVIEVEGVQRSRAEHIQREAYSLANKLKKQFSEP